MRYKRHFSPIFPSHTIKTPSARLSDPVDGVFLFYGACDIPFAIVAFVGYRGIYGLSWHLWAIVAFVCSAIISGHDGYVIADLYIHGKPAVYEIYDSMKLDLRCYTISAEKSDIGNEYAFTIEGTYQTGQ